MVMELITLGGYSLGSAFIAEVVITFIFLMVNFEATSSKAPAGFAGIAIGLALAMIHMVYIPITGTSVESRSEPWTCGDCGGVPRWPNSGCSLLHRSSEQ